MIHNCSTCKHPLNTVTDPCRKCHGGSRWESKLITNADRIRAMSNEQLADFLLHVCDWNWREWLNEPADT